MAQVTIDSGEFPLLRRININHQPSMEKVVAKWMWAFQTNVPESLNALADVIEDIYSHPRLLKYHKKTPEEMLEYIGITGLNLEDPAKLIRTLRGEFGEKAADEAVKPFREKKYERDVLIHELRAEGKTQQAIADVVELDQSVVSKVLCKKPVITPKLHKKREQVGYRITTYTKPEVAVQKIREIFGDDYWLAMYNSHQID